MKLTYRGVNYDYTPNSVPQKGSAIDTGTYRGASVTFYALAEQPPQPRADLTWRGVPYRSGTQVPVADSAVEPAVAEPVVIERIIVTAPVAEPVAAEPAAPVAVADTNPGVIDQARSLFIRHHQRMRRREQGMMVRLAAEVGMSVEDAAHYESHIQGKMPHDFSGYDRSSTSMS